MDFDKILKDKPKSLNLLKGWANKKPTSIFFTDGILSDTKYFTDRDLYDFFNLNDFRINIIFDQLRVCYKIEIYKLRKNKPEYYEVYSYFGYDIWTQIDAEVKAFERAFIIMEGL